MSDLNKVFLIGRMTRDPETRQFDSGSTVCNFSIAVNEKRGDEEKAIFIDCQAWNKVAQFVDKYMSKGKLILVEGKLSQDSWTDKQGGGKRTKTLVSVFSASFVGDRPSGNGVGYADKKVGNSPGDYAPGYNQQREQPAGPPPDPAKKDDLPF